MERTSAQIICGTSGRRRPSLFRRRRQLRGIGCGRWQSESRIEQFPRPGEGILRELEARDASGSRVCGGIADTGAVTTCLAAIFRWTHRAAHALPGLCWPRLRQDHLQQYGLEGRSCHRTTKPSDLPVGFADSLGHRLRVRLSWQGVGGRGVQWEEDPKVLPYFPHLRDGSSLPNSGIHGHQWWNHQDFGPGAFAADGTALKVSPRP
mmetsp:Transcript_9025/g.21431  ORF Transcript_9025/g.21431 Transcript_9025/m.21431 type:complete len:207 (-) Transcript_9025:952-1572(-)